MNTATWKIRISLFCVVGLLAWAGLASDARLALAQSQQECPLPAGGTPVAPPEVEAQEVENGTGSLMDFALSARDRFREQAVQATTPGQSQYFACLIRQKESPWRYGSTYLVTLTPDGRVYVHAKDMSLSGRQLKTSIYGGILRALGINPAVLADRAAARAAFAAAEAGNGGSFDIPGIPGASGYASAYTSLSFRTPAVLLAGFDLDSSHLAPETIEHITPAVTARDVVDRESLKAFVTAGGEYFLEILRTRDQAALSKARVALRDPNGPWRHGSVYLYVWNLTSNLVLFHGAFPDRFELRRAGTARDAVTGELIADQVVRAANSGPEGGFIQYYFDDPTDDNDSADIPKVGYVRKFEDQIQGADGIARQVSFVVGSGLYLSDPGVIAARQSSVIESVLPQVMRAMTASTVDAVSSRMERATSDTAPATSLSFGGASTLSDAILANGHALQDGTFDLTRLLARSSFNVALNAAGNGGGGPFGNLTLWGSGDYRSISGGNPQSADYDGSVTSANLGVDTRLGADLLAGLAVSQARGTVDYTDSYALTGELTTSLTSLTPYLGWQMAGGMNLWAMAGYGTGEVEIADESADAQASDLTQQMFAVGASGPLLASDDASGGTSLNLKGEAAFTSADIDGSGSLESMSLSASRQRLVLEGVYDQRLASGATFSPSLEIGFRNDGGDGETGTGIEAGGGLHYSDPASGMTLSARVRTLLSHGGDYEELGVSGLIRVGPGASGRGLAFSVQPAWGQAASGVQQLWEAGTTGVAIPADDAAARLNAEVGYGLGASRPASAW